MNATCHRPHRTASMLARTSLILMLILSLLLGTQAQPETLRRSIPGFTGGLLVFVGGTLVGTFDHERLLERNVLLVQLAEDPKCRLDRLADASATDDQRARRKRRLIKGPSEFREMRGRKPKDEGRKSASNIGSNISFAAICAMRSLTVGIPSGRCLPSGFGM